MTRPVVLCALDLGPATRRVLYHAVGLARVFDADLKIVHVAADTSSEAHERVLNECLKEGPYGAIDDADVVLRSGRVSEMVEREALKHKAVLIVMGSRGHAGLARLLLGSTSAALLHSTRTPTLLVPPIDMDIVSIGDRAALTCGPVIAAVDLEENSEHQLRMASRMAGLASQPLLLLTVARARVSEHDAAHSLRERAHGLAPVRPLAVIVRRGDVAEEISRCAVKEGAGLVVMGLRERPRGRAGAIASAVLKTGKAFVMAVPGS